MAAKGMPGAPRRSPLHFRRSQEARRSQEGSEGSKGMPRLPGASRSLGLGALKRRAVLAAHQRPWRVRFSSGSGCPQEQP